MENIKLTEYSHGAGCGCKIAPAILDSILDTTYDTSKYKNLIVGNNSKDDAAAYDLGDGTSVLSTTDFFMPIVDDPFIFGKIAATNAISDIYAMGGNPLMAISILGWPINIIEPEVAKQVIAGAQSICEEAGIPLAGGHSIDSPEPIYGLAVTGLVENSRLKKNNEALADCEIFLTKPLGIGILTTAQKKKIIEPGDINVAIDEMCKLNSIGAKISALDGVVALTDVTGFGLLGHLSEICEASEISATIIYNKVPLLMNTIKYLELGAVPGGTYNNYKSYGHKIGAMSDEQTLVLCDAQTSGGLLVIVKKDCSSEFLEIAASQGLSLEPIGYTCKRSDKLIQVI